MESDSGAGYDEGLESGDPMDDDSDLGDATQDGTSNMISSGSPSR